jgi:ABC-type glycerol-3-phosphate transport system substrate-binding protein
MSHAMMIAAAIVLALAGCAGTSQKPDPLNQKEMLAFTGFTLDGDVARLASTPAINHR